MTWGSTPVVDGERRLGWFRRGGRRLGRRRGALVGGRRLGRAGRTGLGSLFERQLGRLGLAVAFDNSTQQKQQSILMI